LIFKKYDIIIPGWMNNRSL